MAVPKLRFPEFTDDWEQRKLSEVVTEIKRTDEKSDAPVMMITAENGFINQSERYSTNNAGQSLKKYILLEKGELAYNHGASKLRPYGSCFALTTEEKARIPFVYHCFSTETENSEFLSIVLNGKAVEKQLRRIVSSGARMDGLLNISFDEYTSIPVMLPRKDEQDRIAEYFKNLDHHITLHQRKLEDLRILKKSMLQKMFPSEGNSVPEVRFPEFTAAWEQRKLSNIADIVGGGTPSTSNPDYWDGDIDWYTPAEIGEQIFAYGSVRKITKEGLIHSSAKILPAHKTVLFTSRAGIGNMAILKRPAATNQGFQSLVCHDDIDPYFMFSMGDSIKAKAERVAAGSTFAEISGKKLGELEFMFPDTDEQKAIGAYFKNLDYLITLHQRKCDDLQKLKKALLQQMFC